MEETEELWVCKDESLLQTPVATWPSDNAVLTGKPLPVSLVLPVYHEEEEAGGTGHSGGRGRSIPRASCGLHAPRAWERECEAEREARLVGVQGGAGWGTRQRSPLGGRPGSAQGHAR